MTSHTSHYLNHLTEQGVLSDPNKKNDDPVSGTDSKDAEIAILKRKVAHLERDVNYITLMMLESLLTVTGGQKESWDAVKQTHIEKLKKAPEPIRLGLVELFNRLIVDKFS